MFERLRQPVLRLLRVPHDPDPPAGAPGSLRVFRAGRNYYKLRLARWGLGQIGALIGIVVSLGFLARIQHEVAEARGDNEPPPVRATPVDPAAESQDLRPAAVDEPRRREARANSRRSRFEPARRFAERSPDWIFPLLNLLEAGGVLLYLIQIPFTYALVRLDFELRWYMVTDRSLRIRAGLTRVLESTMSFANVQQVVISQGPLQRLLGLADLHVQSAGGGGAEERKPGQDDSLHHGVFHGVDNAEEIRDLILDRLKRFREAGLGDPDDTPSTVEPSAETAPASNALTAARELLAEVRTLKQSFR